MKTEYKHTPGPWFVYRAPHGLLHVLPCQEPTINTRQICTFNGSAFWGESEISANARLIAAAPDLLAALELIHANAGESPELIRARIEPVISKALNGSA